VSIAAVVAMVVDVVDVVADAVAVAAVAVAPAVVAVPAAGCVDLVVGVVSSYFAAAAVAVVVVVFVVAAFVDVVASVAVAACCGHSTAFPGERQMTAVQHHTMARNYQLICLLFPPMYLKALPWRTSFPTGMLYFGQNPLAKPCD